MSRTALTDDSRSFTFVIPGSSAFILGNLNHETSVCSLSVHDSRGVLGLGTLRALNAAFGSIQQTSVLCDLVAPI